MRCAVIVYHKNVLSIYKPEWIIQCVESIENQTFQDFDIFELNYGGGEERFCKGKFFSLEMNNHINAMNALISLVFEMGYDMVANVNLDDYYHPERLEKQISKIRVGYQLVSSNFYYFGEKDRVMDMAGCGDIGRNLQRNHNVIAHPVIMMHRSFWDGDLHYRNLLGYEDLDLWKRAYAKGKKFYILKDYLLYYRIHSNQITKEYGITGKKDREFIGRRH